MENHKILIVEDDPAMQMAIQQSILKIDCLVCGLVLSGEEAIENARKLKPDLVLMDIHLEGNLNGTEAAIVITEELQIPIIFITADSDDAILQKAMQSIPSGYLVKPYSERDLWIQMELAFNRKRAEDRQKNLYYPLKIQQIMKEHNLIFIYEGHFTQLIVNSIFHKIEKYGNIGGEDEFLQNKIINVIVECLQNISKYAVVPPNSDQHDAIFMIREDGDKYSLITGNYLENNVIDILKSKLDEVNSLDKQELKKLYKKIRLSGNINEKGGAGLGFIDMARKSGNKLVYEFEQINDHLSYFLFHVNFQSEKPNIEEAQFLN